jgi:hypothetical protein
LATPDSNWIPRWKGASSEMRKISALPACGLMCDFWLCFQEGGTPNIKTQEKNFRALPHNDSV